MRTSGIPHGKKWGEITRRSQMEKYIKIGGMGGSCQSLQKHSCPGAHSAKIMVENTGKIETGRTLQDCGAGNLKKSITIYIWRSQKN